VNKEYRDWLINEIYKKRGDAKMIAVCQEVSERTVYRIVSKFKEKGNEPE
jgi:transposase